MNTQKEYSNVSISGNCDVAYFTGRGLQRFVLTRPVTDNGIRRTRPGGAGLICQPCSDLCLLTAQLSAVPTVSGSHTQAIALTAEKDPT